MFDLIVLSQQNKFLSRAQLQSPQEVANRVLLILRNAVVGRISIRRVIPKEDKG